MRFWSYPMLLVLIAAAFRSQHYRTELSEQPA
jgi:hypothetical protein